MFMHELTYKDYDGVEKTEKLYFNVSEPEAIKFELSERDGISKRIKEIIATKDAGALMRIFQDLIDISYGIKRDGRFYKSPEILADFKASAAYPIMFGLLSKDDKIAAAFVNGIMPTGTEAKIPSDQ